MRAVLYFATLITAGTMTRAEESSCFGDCIRALEREEIPVCAAYLPEGWDQVPAGIVPAFDDLIDTGTTFVEGGQTFVEIIIEVTPVEGTIVWDEAGWPLVLFGEKWVTFLELEELATKIACSPLTS